MTDPKPQPAERREATARPEDRRGQVSPEQDRARAVADVLRSQFERVEAAREVEARRRKHTRIRRGLLALAWLGMAYIWLGSPSWTLVKPVPRPTLLEETRALRVDVFLQSQKIEAYRQEHGRLPYVLAEAGPVLPGIVYHRKDSRSYTLTATSDLAWVEYDSQTSPLDFVGSAASVLETGSARILP